MLRAVFDDAARLGFLGPGDVGRAMEHARGFVTALRTARRVIDLGSGAGLPGLVLAVDLPDLDVVLVDASERRADVLRRAVGRLGLRSRVAVECRRAEALGRLPAFRGRFDAAVARGFGPPAAVAECAAPLLRLGGQLLVSEPPVADERRWPADGVALLGLRRDELAIGTFASFTLQTPCPDRYPRRSVRQPLF